MHQTSRVPARGRVFLRWPLFCLLLFCLGCPQGASTSSSQRADSVDAGAGAVLDGQDSSVNADEVDGVPAPRELHIATFNVKRFFDTRCDTGSCGGRSYEAQPDEAEFARRADQISDAVRELDADIVLLQEIETEGCLQALADRLSERYSTSAFGEVGYDASLDVGVLATGTLREVRRHRASGLTRPDGSQTRFSREFLEVHLDVDGGHVVVFNAHFKSKANDDPGRRYAEAAAAREIVLSTAAEVPQALVVFGGDLNDTPGSEPLNAIEAGGELFRVASELGVDWTFADFRGTVAIDHLYVALPAEGRFVAGTAAVFRDGRGSWGGSDHAALGARFLVPPP